MIQKRIKCRMCPEGYMRVVNKWITGVGPRKVRICTNEKCKYQCKIPSQGSKHVDKTTIS